MKPKILQAKLLFERNETIPKETRSRGEIPRWRRNRTGRTPSPLQIHQKDYLNVEQLPQNNF